MSFFATFLQSFYAPALYRTLWQNATGYGVRYSLLLFGFIAVISSTVVLLRMPAEAQAMMPPLSIQWLMGTIIILIVAVLLRAAMLLALAVAVRLVAIKRRMPMGYDAAFRLAGVAYTPVAVLDAIVFCLHHGQMTINPLALFMGGVIMLTAIVFSTRGA